MYCLCVNVYCHRVTPQLQLTNISFLDYFRCHIYVKVSVITLAVGDMRSALCSDVTQGRAVNSLQTFRDNLSIPSSRLKNWIIILLDP